MSKGKKAGPADVLTGSARNDRLNGGNGDDTIPGLEGRDRIFGNGGNDTIVGGAGRDTMIGGAGDDTFIVEGDSDDYDRITGGEGYDTVLGGSGDDVFRLKRLDAADSVDLIDGGRGDNVIAGTGGADRIDLSATELRNIARIEGGAGNDRITGSPGDDAIRGGAGNDTLTGGLGADRFVFEPGFGRDKVLDFEAGAGDVIDLIAFGIADFAALADFVTDTRAGASIKLGGDTLTLKGVARADLVAADFLLAPPADEPGPAIDGTAGADTLTGTEGDDVINGLGGDDTLIGSAGADALDGGKGNDTVSYAGSDAGVDIALSGAPGIGGHAEGDTLTGIENIVGSAHDDRLEGNGGDNVLHGNAGADVILAGPGHDTIDGGDGDDTLAAGSGDDIVRGGEGNDRIYGQAGDDVIDGGGGDDTLEGGEGADVFVLGPAFGNDVVLDFVPGEDRIDVGAHGVGSWLEFRTNIAEVNGSAVIALDGGALTLKGVAAGALSEADVIGLESTAVLGGEAGDDLLDGGEGAQVMQGGAGNDVYMVDNAADMVVEHADEGDDSVISSVSYALPDNVETLNLTGSADIDGTGNDGDNTIRGNAGANVLAGGAGDDVLEGGAGADTLIGGEGTDTASYATSASGVNVDLGTGAGSGGDAEGDRLVGIENLTGSAHDDMLSGTSGDNILDGGAGNDRILAGPGNDTVYGGDGDDIVAAGSGDDTVYGGAGNDMLEGGAGDDALYGGEGDDTLYGGAGADLLAGGAGNDRYIVDDALDTVTEYADEGIDTVEASISYALTDNVENLTLIGDADIEGVGNALDNTIVGNRGDNVLEGGAGADILNGWVGNDTASYAGSAAGVTVDLSAGTGVGGDAEGDRLISIENLIGSDFDDRLLGNGEANILDGGAGDDRILAGPGDDTIYGGAGDDVIAGGSGDDRIYGGEGADQLYGQAGRDTFVYTGMSDAGDRIMDFTAGAGGDALDMSELLGSLGYNGEDPFADGVLQARQDGANVLIQVDADGGGDGYSTVVTLINTDEEDLVGDNWVY